MTITTGPSAPAAATTTRQPVTSGPLPNQSRIVGGAGTATGWMRRYVIGLVAVDLIVGGLAVLAAGQIRFGGAPAGLADPQYARLALLLPLAWVAAMALHRGYDNRLLFVGGEEYQRVLRAGVTVTAGIAVGSYAMRADVARGWLLVAVLAAVVFGLLGRYLLRHRLRQGWATGQRLRRVLVVGHDRSVAAMALQLRHERYHGLDVIGACLPPTTAAEDPLPARVTGTDLPVYGTFDEVAASVYACGADAVVVLASPELDGVALRRLAWQLERDGVDLMVASALLDVTGERATLRPVDGLPMLHVEHPRLTGARRMVKEAADRVGAGLLLLLTSPLLLLIAAAVRFDRRAPGPALFRQVRVGRDGVEFRIWKFRTMYTDAEARLAQLRHLNQHDGVLFKLRDDPRVTPIGRWLRRFSLDELPQLVNVVRGEMSLVGPRPGLPDEVARYPSDMHRRLAVKPGLTGLWQVSGRADLTWAESMRLDLRYVENWSLTQDLVILLRTLTAVLRRSGAY